MNDIAVDKNGGVHIAGDTTSKTLPLKDPFAKPKGSTEGFVMSFAPGTFDLTFSSYIGHRGLDVARSLAVDGKGNIHVVGQTNSAKFKTTLDALKRKIGGTADGFLLKITP